MLTKNLLFVHNFDKKMHYLIYYSLLNVDNNGIHINDSVKSKKCNRRLGRWNFFSAGEDFSCGVYHALEIIRQSIFSAMKNNKNSVDIALVPAKIDSDVYYVFNYEEEFENYIDLERLKKNKVWSAAHEHNENCECDKKVCKQIFFRVIKQVLEEMFKEPDYQIKTMIVKNEIISDRSGMFLITFKQDLNVIHIRWGGDKFSNDLMEEQNTPERELQLVS